MRCRDGSFYTGIATDVARRIDEHLQGKRGAKYLRGRGPFEIVYQRVVGDRSVATKIEYRVKQLPRHEKANPDRLPAAIDVVYGAPTVSEGRCLFIRPYSACRLAIRLTRG